MSEPHFIDIHFSKRVAISEVRLYLDYKACDESYTPSKLAVLGGSGYHDLSEVMKLWRSKSPSDGYLSRWRTVEKSKCNIKCLM